MDNLERKVEEVVQDSLAAKEDQAAQVQEVRTVVSVTLEPQVYLAEEVAMDLVVLLEQQVDPAERVQLAPPESEVLMDRLVPEEFQEQLPLALLKNLTKKTS